MQHLLALTPTDNSHLIGYSAVQTTSVVDAWKLELNTQLEEFVSAIEAFNKSVSDLNKYIYTNYSFYEKDEIENVISKWIEKKCQEANEKSSSIGHLKINAERLPSQFTKYKFPRSSSMFSKDPEMEPGLSFHKASPSELAQYVINTFDFDGLEQCINKVSSEIESESFRSAANFLATEFYLVTRARDIGAGMKVPSQKGRYILERAHYGSWTHDRVNSLKRLLDPSHTFEKETGVYGLVDCLGALLEAEKSLPGHNSSVASRTKVNEAMNVEAVFFNEKIKFYFKPEIFEAFISFIKGYTDEEIKNIEVK